MTLFAAIMAGGRGERLWPVSRARCPKYLAPLWNGRTLLAETLSRVEHGLPPARAWIITEQSQAAALRRAAPSRWRARIVAEPRGRNTTTCIGVAALLAQQRDPDAIVVALPADHWMDDARPFWAALRCAARVAERTDRLVTLGITPREPSTAYGYLRVGGREVGWERNGCRVYAAACYVEKPTAARAARLIATRRVYWNAGIFVGTARRFLAEIRRHLPLLGRALDAAAPSIGTARQAQALRALYAKAPAISFDYAVMERTRRAAVVAGRFAWDDLGSWASWLERSPRDPQGNVVQGRHVGVGTRDTLVIGRRDHCIATVGIRNAVIIQTPDATLVCDRGQTQHVREVLAACRRTPALRGWL